MSIRFSPKNFEKIAKHIRVNGSLQKSERGDTREMLGAHLVLTNPLDRIDTHQWRKMNFPFAIGEWLAMMHGYDGIDFFTKFIKSYDQYSSDHMHLDGAYGLRIRNGSTSASDIDAVIDKLKDKPESRRAVLSIYNGTDLYGAGGLNTPCTLSIQFLLRQDKLNMIVNMRSNDLDYGLTNDIVVFTMLHEYVANKLGAQAGFYHHMVGSLHYYTDIRARFEAQQAASHEGRWPRYMRPMNFALNDADEFYNLWLCYLVGAEGVIPEAFKKLNTQYAIDLAAAALCFLNRKTDVGFDMYKLIDDVTIKRVMRPWIREKKETHD